MDFAWVALALNDLLWIGVAFVLGLLAKRIGLPPLVGFLIAGFVLSTQNNIDEGLLKKMADLGITLLLFTIGLKIHLKNILRPQVWAVTLLHTSLVVLLVGGLLMLVALSGLGLLLGLSLVQAALLAFALSFSSTVFVVKALEDKGEIDSLHGRLAIGILIIQDILAVIFLAASTGKLPSVWAFALLLLIPLRPLLFKLFDWVGRGELLTLYGFLLAVGGAEVFELVGVKGDLGALILGVMIASHHKAEELVKTMLGFKDLFLLGFFLSVGLSGVPGMETILLAAMLTPLIVLKGGLFYVLFLKFNLRARTSLLSTINLSNYSEFGLIVVAIGVTNGWIGQPWLLVLALAISFSFVLSAILSAQANNIYTRYRRLLKKNQSNTRLPYDQLVDLGRSKVAVIGMGAVGTGAYDQLATMHQDHIVGIDINAQTVINQVADQRNVLLGDPSDADFWDRVNQSDQLELVLLTLPTFNATMAVVGMLKESGYKGQIAATAKFEDEMNELLEAGVDTVFNMHTEAGAGFAAHAMAQSVTEKTSGHL
jgi:glutathione-regulated potassium-efflux system ancillary protein KefC